MSNDDTPARTQEQPPADQARPQRELTRAEVEEQLRRRSASIDGHMDGLQQELVATGEEAQHTAERTFQQYTLALLGGLGIAGAAVGYWLVRRRRKKRRASASGSWQSDYLDAVREEVRAAAKRGDDPGEAAGRILEGHRPLVVRERGATPTESRGLARTVTDLAGRTLVSIAVKYAVDAASEQFLSSDDAREVEGASENAAPVVGAVSSQE
jgi:hypothetical protein